MRSLLAIASLTIRNALRSKVTLALLVLLAAVAAGVPLTVKGDGTARGEMYVLLRYTLGLSVMILYLVTLWAGCGAIAQEVEERRIQLLVTKPVSRLVIALGKWLGLVAVNGVLLALVSFAAVCMLFFRMPADDTLATRRVVRAPLPDVSAEAHRALRERVAIGGLPDGLTEAQAVAIVERDLLARSRTLAPGGSLSFTFTPGAPLARGVVIRHRFDTSLLSLAPAPLTWRLRGPAGTPEYSVTRTNVPGVEHELTVPDELLAGESLTVQVSSPTDAQMTVVFDPRDGVVALVPAGGIAVNAAKAVGILLARLALLAAIGVAAGALFSMPVASVVGLLGVILLQFTGYVESLASADILVPWHAGSEAPGFADRLLGLFFDGLAKLLAPLGDFDALGALAAGEHIAWSEVARAGLVHALAYAGAVLAAATALFNRRDLGLPEP